MTAERKHKNRFWAAFLNALLPGLGYLYVGSKREFFKVGLLVAGVAMYFVVWFESPNPYPWTGLDTAKVLIELFIAILFGIDAWLDAEAFNAGMDSSFLTT